MAWQTPTYPILIARFRVASDAISRNRRSDENNKLRKQLAEPTWGRAKPPGKLGGPVNGLFFVCTNEMLEWDRVVVMSPPGPSRPCF
jgi:hypothetical protein